MGHRWAGHPDLAPSSSSSSPSLPSSCWSPARPAPEGGAAPSLRDLRQATSLEEEGHLAPLPRGAGQAGEGARVGARATSLLSYMVKEISQGFLQGPKIIRRHSSCVQRRGPRAICSGSEPAPAGSLRPRLPPAMTRFSYAEYFSLFHSCSAPSRSPAPPDRQSPLGLFQGVLQKYKNSKTSQLAPVDPVLKAIREGDEEALKAMIRAGRNLAEPNPDGWLPLHEAAYYGQAACLLALQRAYPAALDQRTLQEETALYLATCRGHLDCLLCLLQAGAEPDISNKSRETPLYKACECKNAEAVRLLVQYNADTNHRCNRGWTALHESVSRNDLEVMDILVGGGAKVEAKNAYGITPLFVAAQSGQLEALRFLAKHGADINTQASDSASALYEACKNEHEEVVSFLLSQGADANKANKDGMLPLHVAAKKGSDRIVQMLLPVTSRTRVRRSGISPLHLAAERNHDAVLEALLGARYDANAPLSPERARLYEDRRSSALYFAVINNNVHAAELLLRAGADPNRDVISPLLVAVRRGCLRTVRLLLAHGADIDARIATHPTAFPATIMFATKCLSLLKFLMDQGCDGEPCFSCLYGTGPHPPAPQRANRFNDAPPADAKAPGAVQFCEILSAPEVSRWAGPIIDILLDYVGNVRLCSRLKEHIDSYEDWAGIREKAEPPRPLAHLCRLQVRKAVGRCRLGLVDTLPLPPRLIRYLKYEDRQ